MILIQKWMRNEAKWPGEFSPVLHIYLEINVVNCTGYDHSGSIELKVYSGGNLTEIKF